MWRLIIATIVIFVLLLLNEWWWRERQHGEISRKWIHIIVGSFVAFWPFFLSWHQIEFLSVVFVLAVIFSKWFGLFKALHTVQRPTIGEVLFGAAVGIVALLAPNAGLYCLALLYMSLADGLAAIIGVKYGSNQAYSIFGSPKSLIGTTTFFGVACVLLLGFGMTGHYVPLMLIAPLLLGATLIENLAVFGLDNLLVPLYVVILFRCFT
jgi:dolichol kinase